jgi:hypothetical protein
MTIPETTLFYSVILVDNDDQLNFPLLFDLLLQTRSEDLTAREICAESCRLFAHVVDALPADLLALIIHKTWWWMIGHYAGWK